MPLWVVICREDPCPENGRGKFTVPTGKLFREEARALRYIAKIERERDPMIGRVTHHNLMYAANDFEDVIIARDRVDTENVPENDRPMMIDPTPFRRTREGRPMWSGEQRQEVRNALAESGQTPEQRHRLRNLATEMGIVVASDALLPPLVDGAGRQLPSVTGLAFDEPPELEVSNYYAEDDGEEDEEEDSNEG